MAKKAAKIEEVVELLRDDKATEVIIGKLGDKWSPAIEVMIEKKIDKIFDAILLKLDAIVEKKINDMVLNQIVDIQQKQSVLMKICSCVAECLCWKQK